MHILTLSTPFLQVPKETVRLDLLLEDGSQKREDPLANYHDDFCQVPKNIPPKNK